MRFIKIPNIPDGPASLAIVDGRISEEIEENLKASGIQLVKTLKYPGLYEAISYHPDIMVHHVANNSIVYAPGTPDGFLKPLSEKGFKMIKGETVLLFRYPNNIAYNVARVGNFAIHNLKYTDPVLLSELSKAGVELIHVKQGYSKCSVSIIDENTIITGDKGIAKAVSQKGIEVLLIDGEENIVLPGLKNGFIGGSTGLIDRKKWAVTGQINTLRSSKKITEFLGRKNIEIVQLSGGEVIDVGSILPLL
ncbi:MAG: hypothetical protein N2645_15630 [Clostridia bacterium]|nr:hypothetical protein [Clostridia bacterium]